MASIFELGDIPGGLLPGVCTLASVTNTATLTAAQSYNSIVRGIPTSTATYTTETAANIIAAIGGDGQFRAARGQPALHSAGMVPQYAT